MGCFLGMCVTKCKFVVVNGTISSFSHTIELRLRSNMSHETLASLVVWKSYKEPCVVVQDKSL